MAIRVNRISDLLDDEPNATPRTPLQQEASRRNGSLSHGPVTAEGKAISRRNSLKHGLFARVVTPPTDARHQDRMYRQIRQELIQELKPRTFTDYIAIDSMVGDIIQLARVRRMSEALQRPVSLKPGLSSEWSDAQDVNRDLRIADRIMGWMDAGQSLACPRRESQRLAGNIAILVEQTLADKAQVDAEDAAMAEQEARTQHLNPQPRQIPADDNPKAPDADDDGAAADWELEEQELARIAELFACVEPAAHRLRDQDYVAAVLRGEQKAKRGDIPRLRRLLAEWVNSWKKSQGDRRDVERRVGNVFHRAELALARSPHQLMLLQRYQRSLEIAIAKKLRQLQRA